MTLSWPALAQKFPPYSLQARDVVEVVGLRHVAMDEVNVCSCFQFREERVALLPGWGKVRTFQPICGTFSVLVPPKSGPAEFLDRALYEAQPGNSGRLFAAFEEHLQADANSEERLAGAHLFKERFDEAVGAQAFHAFAECADAGEHDLARRGQCRRVLRESGIEAQMLKRFFRAPQIAHAIVDDCDVHEGELSAG